MLVDWLDGVGGENAYVEQEFSYVAVLVLLFKVDVAERVDNEHFTVLGNDTLLRSLRPTALGLRSHGSRPGASRRRRLLIAAGAATLARGASLRLGLLRGSLLGVALLKTAQLPVHRHGTAIFILLRWGRRRGGCGSLAVET